MIKTSACQCRRHKRLGFNPCVRKIPGGRNGNPIPSPGDLPILGIKPGSPALQADSLLSEPLGDALQIKGGKKPAESRETWKESLGYIIPDLSYPFFPTLLCQDLIS